MPRHPISRMTLVLTVAAAACFVVNALAGERPGGGGSQDATLDFNRDVRPILSNKCFACHGPDKSDRKAKLRLDTREGALADLGGYSAIVPGKTDDSEMVARITDKEDPMPPKKAHKELTDKERQTLIAWVRQGAEYAKAWAYVSPRRLPAPKVSDEQWPRNFVDRWIMARLDAEGLRPSPEADSATLIRRLTFDLTGLPPTPAEVDAFVNSTDPKAYDNLVDRLLASPHFGERMAIYWLDLVRYADTVGYHGDQDHNASPYRDWVIKAFNDNLPFDRFATEQLAGDLLDKPTQEQLVATCYNRLLQTSHEGGVQVKEYRAIYQADRIRNFSNVFMGATMGCCQCHDHKYDPYLTKDFYSMGAFFADIDDEAHLKNGTNALPTRREPEMRVITPDVQDRIDAIDAQIADAKAELAKVELAALAKQPQWEATLLKSVGDNQPTESAWVDDKNDTGGKENTPWEYVDADTGVVHSGKLARVQEGDGLMQHYFNGAKKPVKIEKGAAFYAWVYLDPADPPKAVMLQFNDGKQWEHRAVWGSDDILFGRKAENHAGYQRRGKLPEAGGWVRLDVPADAVGFKPGATVHGMAFTQYDGKAYWDDAGLIETSGTPAAVAEAIATPADKRNDKQRAALRDYYLAGAPAIAKAKQAIAALDRQRDAAEKSGRMVMITKALATPRVVHVLPRGNWLDESGEIVEPHVPHFLPQPADTDKRRLTRLDLARWLSDPSDHGVAGLTARVQANRFFYLAFGNGIARVLDDFGGQGESPVNPELLDALANEFIDSGWDMKHMMRLLVTSTAYRQSSITPTQLAERDPYNQLVARQSRFRLPAEMVRDTALSVSGLLVDKLYGKPAKPYQPVGYYANLNFPTRKYTADRDENQYRRGVYTHWQRQYLHPALLAFDAPSREECTASRPISNTPLQALTLLNDPSFVEAAHAFAARILTEGGKTDSDRLDFAYRLAVARTPSAAERTLLTGLLDKHRAEFKADPKAAADVPTTGMTKAPAGVDPVELAAWTSVARTILNLNETITRN
ncbi:MAG: DUF1549 domain-containing protein [Phycisphaera sp.]|nr:DUF1549 domain-containing protein [Phycisphaera sp.]